MPLALKPLAPSLGAELTGIDLRQPLTAASRAEIAAALLRYLVVVFPGQALDHAQHAAFARSFGVLQMHGKAEFGETPAPAIVTVSNSERGGHLGSGEVYWHTDTSFYQRPPTYSFLRAHTVTTVGGHTYWANMYEALAALPPALRAHLETLTILHDNSENAAGQPRVALLNALAAGTELPSGAIHPAVCRHPETGKPALYCGRVGKNRVLGLTSDDSLALLRELEAHVAQARFGYEHRWRAGDLVVWDNRCTMHRRDPFPASEPRVMYRCQVYAS